VVDEPFSVPPLPANTSAAPPRGPTSPSRTSRLAVASVVLGILSCPLSILAGIPGLVCGIMGLNRIAGSERTRGGRRLTGQGLAITGIILSGLSILLLPVLAGVLIPAVQVARDANRRILCQRNLQSLARGMFVHEQATGILPASITDADGKPLLSWRVAILPYVEETALYRAFHLDEPWDSPHNLALVPKMPRIFACPAATLEPGKSRYLLLDGPGAGFDRANQTPGDGPAARIRGVRLDDLARTAAGISGTLMIVEAPADRAVEWTKPEELTVSPAEVSSLQDSGGGHGRGIRHAAHADGHIEALAPDGGR
jgi:hypothetical protein